MEMSDMTVNLVWTGGQQFTATNGAGLQTKLDGTHYAAASPVEVLLEALGACTAIDVLIILEKMRMPADRVEITADADRHSPEPRFLTRTRVRFDIWGDGIRNDKVTRAISLSITKYCSVYHSLRKDMGIEAQYRIHSKGSEASGEYHTVIIDEEEVEEVI